MRAMSWFLRNDCYWSILFQINKSRSGSRLDFWDFTIFYLFISGESILLKETVMNWAGFVRNPNLGRDEIKNLVISWSQFCREPLPDRNFTFWEWFYRVMCLTSSDMRGKQCFTKQLMNWRFSLIVKIICGIHSSVLYYSSFIDYKLFLVLVLKNKHKCF